MAGGICGISVSIRNQVTTVVLLSDKY